MESGQVEFRLPSGVVVQTRGPLSLDLVDPMRLRLTRGSLTEDAGAEAKGFLVETANARVLDLGTRFGVSVGGGETDVAVFSGEVEVHRPGAETSAQTKVVGLREGDAVRVDSKFYARRLAAVGLRDGEVAIMEGDAGKAVVARVLDNISGADFNRFYSIVPGAMAPGARAYSTLGRPRWQALEGAEFPGELRGADIVGTFSSDRLDPQLQFTPELRRPASVYLMLDARAAVPSWVREEFQSTALRLRCGPWADDSGTARTAERYAAGLGWVTYNVWKRDAEAGTITLGPPHPDGAARQFAMYGIAVKAR